LLLLAALPHLFAELKQGHYRFSLMADISPTQRYKFFYGMVLSGRHAAKEVRLFSLGPYFLRRVLGFLQEIHGAERSQQRRELRWQAGLGVVSSLVSSVTLVLVIVAAFAERISMGDITLYIVAIASVQTGLSSLLMALAGMNESALFFTYYNDLMTTSSDISSLPPILPAKPLLAEIELRGVSFRYSEQHPWVLKDVNLKIAASECLALVGLNGAGKTTLVKLLTRLYDPTEGVILWDGVDIRRLNTESLRRRVGVIFQDFMRYDLTVQENIGLGCVEHMDDLSRVKQAANEAGIHEVIEAMPNGYQTPLGFMFTDRGSGMDLSGGQWQKLATARLFMRRDADLLILDEPTAALDAQAEYETYARFADLINGRATLLISHRFSTVRMANRIAVLKNGQITECGSHDELLLLAGTYAKLYAMQAEKYTV
jgi:ATP-binding cassette subfamily B protein